VGLDGCGQPASGRPAKSNDAALGLAARNQAPAISLPKIYGWLLLYMAGWAVGGILLYSVLAIFEAPGLDHLPEVIGTWTVAGSASMLAILLPSGFGIVEVTVTALLSRLVPSGVAVMAALGVRLLTTLLDLIVGGLAYLLEMTQRAQ
jgi:uncharacterized membrane protein YbhN (UPF0104 family)